MIRVEKDLTKVPASLLDKDRIEAFQSNVANKAYSSKDHLYKGKDVKDALDRIYHKKCAFCEKKLLDTARHVEHYRPKRNKKVKKCDATYAYFWLSFSWDNLLLACAECNVKKGNCFDIEGERAEYKGESLPDLQQNVQSYANKEKPKMIHPEFEEDLEEKFSFDINSRLQSSDPRFLYTIDGCELNRDELIERRISYLNDLKNNLNDSFKLFSGNGDWGYFQKDVEEFVRKTKPEEEFFAWKRTILKNVRTFLANHPTNPDFNDVIELAFFKFLPGEFNPA
ncbi:MAG: hypothetical protein H6581_06350 [Bacteroidia bacterium]|nr:hypothetical protein [Bacteroidia bacterium]